MLSQKIIPISSVRRKWKNIDFLEEIQNISQNIQNNPGFNHKAVNQKYPHQVQNHPERHRTLSRYLKKKSKLLKGDERINNIKLQFY